LKVEIAEFLRLFAEFLRTNQLVLVKTTFVWFSVFTIQFLFNFWKGFILQNL